MDQINPQIPQEWKELLAQEFSSKYFFDLKEFLISEKKQYTIYPPGSLMFNAFNNTKPSEIKIVILGQDPYHGSGQAHGLCFSVPKGIAVPPSLVNIFKELNNDLGMPIPNHGNLEKWAQQGVFLLNATLSVRASQAGSHQGKGWEQFTDAVISKISQSQQGVVFMLWGNYAKAKEKLIDAHKHLILKAPHPSPLSAYHGFLGCKHFSMANNYLEQQGKTPIDWTLQ
jgi:uracil-DNA glycosylase